MMRWLHRRLGRQAGTVADASPAADDVRLLFRVVAEKRQRRETEGRHLFQELERRRAEAAASAGEAVRAAVPDPVREATVAPTPSSALAAATPPRRRAPRPSLPRPRLPRVRIPRRIVIAMPVALIALSLVGTVIAHFTSTGSGDAAASVATLASPSVDATNPTPNVAHIAWTSVPSPNSPTLDSEIEYRVERKPTSGSTWVFVCGTDMTPKPYNVLACNDNVTLEDDYDYRVTAHFRSWTSKARARCTWSST